MWLLPTRNLFAKTCGLEDVKYFAFFAEPLRALRPFSDYFGRKEREEAQRALSSSYGTRFLH